MYFIIRYLVEIVSSGGVVVLLGRFTEEVGVEDMVFFFFLE